MRQFLTYCIAATAFGCATAPPPPPPALPGPPPPPLERICQETLPLRQRTVGELVSTLKSIAPFVEVTTRACDRQTAWPIAYAETGQGRPPIGIAVLRMEGDALLTFEARDREAPTVKLCAELEARIDERHRFRAVALWKSDDEGAFDPARLQASRAEVAWLELLSRTPSDCALGKREKVGQPGEDELRAKLRCAVRAYVLAPSEDCDLEPPPVLGPTPSVEEVERAAARTHRYTFEGRTAVREGEFQLQRPERCLHEPAPATHDVCLGEYTRAGHPDERWYGRSDVTRTGTAGEKNYVDSFLTFQLLKRLEAERRSQLQKPPAPAPAPKK